MSERQVSTKRKIQVRMVEDERGRLKYYRLNPYKSEDIEVIVENEADEPIEIKKCSHHLSVEQARCLLATLQRAVKLLES